MNHPRGEEHCGAKNTNTDAHECGWKDGDEDIEDRPIALQQSTETGNVSSNSEKSFQKIGLFGGLSSLIKNNNSCSLFLREAYLSI